MRLSRLFSTTLVLGIATTATFFACGGGGGGGGGTIDAKKVYNDSKVFMDAAPGVMGLGQKCGSAEPACPSNASDCIGPPGTSQTFCTPNCEMNGSGTSNGSGQLPLSSVTPLPNNATCTAAFTGSAGTGTAACYAVLASVPTLGTTPNTHYTGITMDCAILCGTGSGTGACPPAMTCNAQGLCLPN